MNSSFYRSYNICKNYQLDEFYNTTELVRFLNQMPELIQTNEHHFSNNKDFKHYLSITLLCAAQHDNWFDESPESHATNLIVVVSSRLNNAHLFVRPLLLRICQFLNWELIGDDEDAIDHEDELDGEMNRPDGMNIDPSPLAPFRRLNDDEREGNVEDEEEDIDDDDENDDNDDYNTNISPYQFHPN